MPHGAGYRLTVGGIGLVALAAGLLTPIARADEAEASRIVRYIALGDSFTAAPLSSKPSGTRGGPMGFDGDDNPYTCGQSNTNYPRQIARQLGLYTPLDDLEEADLAEAHPEFIDISCGGATTEHMTASQTAAFDRGENKPQFSAFDGIDRETVRLVTIGIGGNDIGFGKLQSECVEKPNTPGGIPCSENPTLRNQISADLAALALTLPPLLDEIRAMAPNAIVLVFGYPALLPEEPDLPIPEGCYPYIPILPPDVAYLRGVELELNQTIENAATVAGAHYVDWYGPSIGHDMCKPPGVAWVNGLVLVPPSYPVHPNLLGSDGAAREATRMLEDLDFSLTP